MDQKKLNIVDFVFRKPLHWFLFTLLLAGGSAFVAYFVGREIWNQQNELLQQHQETLNKQITQLQHAQQQQQILQVDLNVQRKANEVMQKELAALQVNQVALEKQISFYRKVLAPEETYSGAWVDKFVVEQAAGENRYRFRLILVHEQKMKRFVKGFSQLTLVGVDKDKQPFRQNLLALIQEPTDSLAFSFRFFQSFTLEFQLPAGVEVENVEIETTLPSSRWQALTKNTQQFTWQLDDT